LPLALLVLLAAALPYLRQPLAQFGRQRPGVRRVLPVSRMFITLSF
jgi:hypothetical protein